MNEDFERPADYDAEVQLEKEEQADTLAVGENAVTYDDYIGKQGGGEIQQPVNESKEKVTEEELLKDIGKAVPLESQKSGKEEDEHKEVQHNKKNLEDYHMSTNIQNPDLLGTI